MWVEFVSVLVPALKRFSPGTLGIIIIIYLLSLPLLSSPTHHNYYHRHQVLLSPTSSSPSLQSSSSAADTKHDIFGHLDKFLLQILPKVKKLLILLSNSLSTLVQAYKLL